MAKQTSLPAGITPEMVAAFMAQQAKEKEAAEKSKIPTLFKTHVEVREAYPNIEGHTCTILKGGRKEHFKEGETVQCYFVGRNRRGTSDGAYPYAYVRKADGSRFLDGDRDIGYIHPKFLKGGKALSDAAIATYKAERGERQTVDPDEMILIPMDVIDQSKEKSIKVKIDGTFGFQFFPKSLVEEVGTHGDKALFEVPAWKIANDLGMIALEGFRTKQAEYEKSRK